MTDLCRLAAKHDTEDVNDADGLKFKIKDIPHQDVYVRANGKEAHCVVING